MDNKSSSKQQALTKNKMGIKPGLPLQVSGDCIEALRADIQRLMDIEAIKQVKHAYFRCIDTANMDELATLYHDDVFVHFLGGTYEWKIQGKQELINKQRAAFHSWSVGHHNGHHPEIQLLSDTEATGIWYLADTMWSLNKNAVTSGTAIYWDCYQKVSGRWLISESKYERLYEINQILDKNPQLSSHYLAEHGAEPG